MKPARTLESMREVLERRDGRRRVRLIEDCCDVTQSARHRRIDERTLDFKKGDDLADPQRDDETLLQRQRFAVVGAERTNPNHVVGAIECGHRAITHGRELGCANRVRHAGEIVERSREGEALDAPAPTPVHDERDETDPERSECEREGALPDLARKLKAATEDGADEEVRASGRSVGRFDVAGEEGDDAVQDDQRPAGGLMIDEGSAEQHANPAGHANPEQSRSADAPLVESVLTDRPE
jgi:hypothetical protein